MKRVMTVLGALALAGAASAAQPDQASARLRSAAETCLRTQAARVAAQAIALDAAETFLVDGLCAADIRRSETYDANAQLLAGMKATAEQGTSPMSSDGQMTTFDKRMAADAARQSASLAKVSVDPETGDLFSPPGFELPISAMASAMALARGASASHAAFRTLAAEALLAAREGAKPR